MIQLSEYFRDCSVSYISDKILGSTVQNRYMCFVRCCHNFTLDKPYSAYNSLNRNLTEVVCYGTYIRFNGHGNKRK